MTGMSVIVKTVARWVVAFIFLYGIYIMAYGHLTPGGGFAGGVIMASAFVLWIMAYGRQHAEQLFPYRLAIKLDSVAGMMFWLVAMLGLFAGAGFFVNVIHRRLGGYPLQLVSAGIIPLCNLAVALKVCASLVAVTVLLAVVRVVRGGSDDEFRGVEDEP